MRTEQHLRLQIQFWLMQGFLSAQVQQADPQFWEQYKDDLSSGLPMGGKRYEWQQRVRKLRGKGLITSKERMDEILKPEIDRYFPNGVAKTVILKGQALGLLHLPKTK